MTPKEYLSQARWLDMRINSKLQQIESLHSLATKASSTLSNAPHSGAPEYSPHGGYHSQDRRAGK